MTKDPSEVLPFTVDWSAWLANEGDTAASATWFVPTGIVQETNPPRTATLADGKATIWLSGGTDRNQYKVTSHLTTVGGRIAERSIVIDVRER